MFISRTTFKKLGSWLAPPPQQSTDGRDQWPSRAAFLLAAMGGCAGQGNLLRYPSVTYNNHGLQWFIPYLLAIFLIAIPALILEVAIGQAYRGGTVVAFNGINKRLRGIGLGPVFVSFIVVQYFVTNLAWILVVSILASRQEVDGRLTMPVLPPLLHQPFTVGRPHNRLLLGRCAQEPRSSAG